MLARLLQLTLTNYRLQDLKIFLLALLISIPPVGLTIAKPSQASINLPTLANPSISASLSTEYQLGRNWARILRGRAPLLNDPITFHYIDELLWDLVPHSELSDRRLELILIDNPTFNAFAVPGGIIGVHSGLIVAAGSEDELASVLAHEIAHLSQRHYAQRIEEERRNRPMVLAGVLASILIASANPEGGAAVLTGTVGAQAQAQLNFSRRNEEEADRIGMQTLAAANRDPRAMPQMFSRLQRSHRFSGQQPPEFLLTHPVTESRIADSLNRAETLPPVTPRPASIDFDIIKTRMEVHLSNQPSESLQRFLSESQDNNTAKGHYGVLLSAMRTHELSLARHALDQLPNNWRQHLYVELSEIELLLAEQNFTTAQQKSERMMSLYPDSYPVMKVHAAVMYQSGQPALVASVYRSILQSLPTDVDSWYQLAETEGLAGNITGVHEARIEYFLLTGNIDSAMQQVTFAQRERNLHPSDLARLEQLEAETIEIRRQLKEDF